MVVPFRPPSLPRRLLLFHLSTVNPSSTHPRATLACSLFSPGLVTSTSTDPAHTWLLLSHPCGLPFPPQAARRKRGEPDQLLRPSARAFLLPSSNQLGPLCHSYCSRYLCEHITPACHLCHQPPRVYHAGHHLGGKLCYVLSEPNCRELVLPNLTRSACATSPGLLPSYLSERILLALCSVLAIGYRLEIGLATIRATPRRQSTGDPSVSTQRNLHEHCCRRPAQLKLPRGLYLL